MKLLGVAAVAVIILFTAAVLIGVGVHKTTRYD